MSTRAPSVVVRYPVCCCAGHRPWHATKSPSAYPRGHRVQQQRGPRGNVMCRVKIKAEAGGGVPSVDMHPYLEAPCTLC
jgi:hypothetical protein